MKNNLFSEEIQAVKEETYFHFNMHPSQGELLEAFCNDLNKTSIFPACKHSVFFIIHSGSLWGNQPSHTPNTLLCPLL